MLQLIIQCIALNKNRIFYLVRAVSVVTQKSLRCLLRCKPFEEFLTELQSISYDVRTLNQNLRDGNNVSLFNLANFMYFFENLVVVSA